jgi:acyl transferase domain-containing protein/NADPH:quinone reductase-like Zn-dependent oxidoreductase/acyl carrier protein
MSTTPDMNQPVSTVTSASSTMSAVKLALLARQLRSQVDSVEILAAEPIAIIGMGCRFPGGVDSPAAFWDLLRSGEDPIVDVPSDRWDVDAFYDPRPYTAGKINTRRGGFLDDIASFDAGYFGISPREASRMDPQQRLLLEVAIEALQRAGQPSERVAGSLTGVFVAATMSDYSDRQYQSIDEIDAYSITGNIHCIIANRLSFLLDLRGPSIAVDTACSSSLVAVHMACQSLRARESDMAVAGGVNVILSPEPSIALAKWGVLAPDGRCKTFDAAADGFVRSEGCGVIVLKRLSDAIAGDDPIVAVIRGSAVNQDGRSTAMSAPNGLAQQDVIRRALNTGRVRPEQIGCVEMHGTGTVLGDPIEVEALAEVMGPRDVGALPVALTAVKSSIGHAEAAAGLAGRIKMALAMRHEAIPPNLHFTALNPHISLEGTRFFLPTELHPWPAGEAPRLAGVSSFGFGGTNAHVVVEEAPRLPATPRRSGPFVLPVSASTPAALHAAAEQLAAHLEAALDDATGDICFTAAVRRTHYSHRLVVVGANREQLVERLRLFVAGESRPGIATRHLEPGARRRVAFVFSGQGPQWWAMGRELLATNAVFADVVRRCDALLREYFDWSLLDEFSRAEAESRLDRTEFAQPAIFALQVGLAAMWQSWGIEPDAVVGHSVGEVAAAHLSGALTLEAAVRVIAHRARLMQRATGNGTMASVGCTAAALQAALEPFGERLSIAAINAPATTVISGDTAAMDEVIELLQASGANVRRLPVDYAFHSAQMVPHAQALAEALVDLVPATNRVRFVSTVTGAALDGTDLTSAYWAANVREPVRFADAIASLISSGIDVFVEVGPHPVLGSAIIETLAASAADRTTTATTVPSLRRGRPEIETMLAALGELHCSGVAIDWTRVVSGRGHVEELPTYPWQRQRHWHEAMSSKVVRYGASARHHAGALHPLVGHRVRAAAITGQVFERNLSARDPSFLADHRFGQHEIVSATTFLEMASAAFAAATNSPAGRIEDVELLAALALPASDDVTVQVHLGGDRAQHDARGHVFRIHSLRDDTWTLHATGRVSAVQVGDEAPPDLDLAAIRARCVETVEGDDLYARLAARGAHFGPSFRGVERIWVGGGEALGHVLAPVALDADDGRYHFHPALLDALLHPLNVLLSHADATFLPVALASISFHRPPDRSLWSHVRLLGDASGSMITADITVVSEEGAPVADLRGLRLRRTSLDALSSALAKTDRHDPADELLYEKVWQSRAGSVAADLPGGPWLVFADRDGVGSELAEALRGANACCTVVPATVELTRAVVVEALRVSEATEVVYARVIDTAPIDASDDPIADQRDSLGGALELTQAMIHAPARLWLLTRGAHGIDGPPTSPEQATLVGFGATVAVEQPELRCVRVDLDPTATTDRSVAGLLAALRTSDREDEVALRGTQQLVARLVPVASRTRSPAAAASGARLVSSRPGTIDALEWQPSDTMPVRDGEVEIRVRATGLNFRDVLIALDLYPDKVSTFGEECSGEIVRVGSGVHHLAPGDRVLGMGSGAFASHLTTDADLAIRMPDTMGFDEAATIPIAFLTAHYALEQLGRLAPGERVLIHAAAGGVGMAAVQLAQRLGAEVYATAGNDEKRALLRSLGVQHVFDSRSVDFTDGVRRATQGQGVDVVLNSLSGDFIARSLDVLTPGGRFLEIGKRDIWTSDRVAVARPDVEYFVVFLGDLSIGDPPAIQAMLRELMHRFEVGELTALPRTAFPLDDVAGAFRYMAQARHVGKVIVVHAIDDDRASAIRDDATYLITGGLGGIGLQVARRLALRGARSLALLGRHAPDTHAREAIDEIRRLGADVRCFEADVSLETDLALVFDEVHRALPQLRGIVHAAGVNDDATMPLQTWGSFEHALAPKLAGALNLHRAARDLPLDFVVYFSSASAVVGGPGQANYTTANAFLDALACVRRIGGRTDLSIGWGPWDRVGMTADLERHHTDRMRRLGYRSMSAEDALDAFEVALGTSRSHVVAIALDRTVLAERPIFADLHGPSSAAIVPVEHNVVERWLAAPVGMRRATIANFVRAQAVKVLGLAASTPLGPRQPFSELGLDSLMAVELRNGLGAALGRSLSATLLFDYPTSDALTDYLLATLPEPGGSTGPDERPLEAVRARSGSRPSTDEVMDAMAALSEEEAEAMLLAELDNTESAS